MDRRWGGRGASWVGDPGWGWGIELWGGMGGSVQMEREQLSRHVHGCQRMSVRAVQGGGLGWTARRDRPDGSGRAVPMVLSIGGAKVERKKEGSGSAARGRAARASCKTSSPLCLTPSLCSLARRRSGMGRSMNEGGLMRGCLVVMGAPPCPCGYGNCPGVLQTAPACKDLSTRSIRMQNQLANRDPVSLCCCSFHSN